MDSTSSSLIIRDYRKGDEIQINTLLDESYENWAGSNYWEWMYSDSIHGHNIVVAEKDEKIIGCNHGIYLKARIGETDYLVHFSNFAAVDREHRRKGVYTRIVQRAFENAEQKVSFGYSFTRNPIIMNNPSLKIERKFFPRHFTVYTYVDDIDKHLKYFNSRFSFFKKHYHHITKKFNKIGIKNINKNIEIMSIRRFDDRFTDFHEVNKKRYNFIIEKNQKFLNWRYSDERSGGYEILTAELDDKILGYLVYKINIIDKDYPYGMIIDLLSLPKEVEAEYLLIDKAIEELKTKGVNSVNFLVNNGNPVIETLKKIGFIDLKRRQFITYVTKITKKDETLLMKSPSKKIHLTYGDVFA